MWCNSCTIIKSVSEGKDIISEQKVTLAYYRYGYLNYYTN